MRNIVQSQSEGLIQVRLLRVLTILVIFVLICLVSLKYVSPSKKQKVITNQTSQAKLDPSTLRGSIIYSTKDNFYKLDVQSLKSTEIQYLGPAIEGSGWSYANGYLFADTENGIVAALLSGITRNEILLANGSYKETPETKEEVTLPYDIYPSKDGSKVAIVIRGPLATQTDNLSTGQHRLYVINMTTQKVTPLMNVISEPQWFSDSRYLYTGDKDGSVYDSVTGTSKLLPRVGSHLVSIGNEDDSYLWFPEERVPTTSYREDDIVRPDMVLSSLKAVFPTIPSDYVVTDQFTSFFQFPVISRDFKAITKVLPGKLRNEFFLEIDTGRSDIYYVDGFTTFKKLNPNNPYSYYLLDFNAITHKILALKYLPVQTLKGYSADASLVILDQGNYAEHIADIDKAHFYEKKVTSLPNDILPTDYTSRHNALFSPDGHYVLAAVRRSTQVPYTIFSLDHSTQLTLPQSLGNKVYWVSEYN